jgi:hypothetical protein
MESWPYRRREANNDPYPLGSIVCSVPGRVDRHRIKRISKFAAARETNLVRFAGYRERAAQSAMPAAKKEVPNSLWRFEHQRSGGVIPLDRSKTMTKHGYRKSGRPGRDSGKTGSVA